MEAELAHLPVRTGQGLHQQLQHLIPRGDRDAGEQEVKAPRAVPGGGVGRRGKRMEESKWDKGSMGSKEGREEEGEPSSTLILG